MVKFKMSAPNDQDDTKDKLKIVVRRMIPLCRYKLIVSWLSTFLGYLLNSKHRSHVLEIYKEWKLFYHKRDTKMIRLVKREYVINTYWLNMLQHMLPHIEITEVLDLTYYFAKIISGKETFLPDTIKQICSRWNKIVYDQKLDHLPQFHSFNMMRLSVVDEAMEDDVFIDPTLSHLMGKIQLFQTMFVDSAMKSLTDESVDVHPLITEFRDKFVNKNIKRIWNKPTSRERFISEWIIFENKAKKDRESIILSLIKSG